MYDSNNKINLKEEIKVSKKEKNDVLFNNSIELPKPKLVRQTAFNIKELPATKLWSVIEPNNKLWHDIVCNNKPNTELNSEHNDDHEQFNFSNLLNKILCKFVN